ncbi:MAG: hypothetical protein ACRENP_15675 [Longimicrobiales bacterium]
MRLFACSFSASAWLALLVLPLSAQTVALNRLGRYGLAVEIASANFPGTGTSIFSDATRFPSGVLFLSSHAALNSSTRLIVELPFAFETPAASPQPERRSVMGNPYFGLHFRGLRSSLDLGARLPLLDKQDLVSGVGAATEFERVDAFLPHVTSFGAVLQSLIIRRQGAAVTMSSGCALWLATGPNNVHPDNRLACTLGLEPALRRRAARVGARLLIRANSDGDWFNLEHEQSFFAERTTGVIRPGLALRMRFDDYYHVLALSLQIVPRL